jgi:hypothetical protein
MPSLHYCKIFIFSLFVISLRTQANAIESICPGGSNPRPDITWCVDHENFASPNCKEGSEEACTNEAGYDGKSHQRIVRTNAAIGSGAIEGVSEPGGVGPGFLNMPSQPPSLGASMRFYVKFHEGFLQSQWDRGNHGPTLQTNEDDCSVIYSLDWSDYGPSMILQSSCTNTFLVPNNIKDYPMKNNIWYLVEIQAKMNTTTSGPGEFDGNGELRAYVNGEKILEYTNVNLRGNTNKLFETGYVSRAYYGVGIPAWSGKISFDGFAYSNTGQYIGPSNDENNRGTPDPLSPYINFTSYNGYVGSKMANDCTSPGVVVGYTPIEEWWRNKSSLSLTNEIAHGGYKNSCAPELESSPKVILNNITDSSRIKGTPISNSNTLTVKGKILLPSGSNYSSKPSFLGFYKNNGIDNQLALSINGQKWAIKQKGASLDTIIKTSTTPVAFDEWNEFELSLTRDNKTYLKINNQAIIPAFTPTTPPNWAWDDIGGSVQLGPLNETPKTLDKSLKIHLTKSSDGGGVSYYMTPEGKATTFAVHGWVYLPSTNQYAGAPPVALSGIAGTGTTDSLYNNYISVGINDGKWAIVQKNGGSTFASFTSNKLATLNTWHEFELFVEKSGSTSLMIDRQWILDNEKLDSELDWIWYDDLGGIKQFVLGVIDFKGTPPFTVYTDDTDVLTPSAWSCKGWSPESCPFK